MLISMKLQINCNWFKQAKQINFIGKIERQNNGVTIFLIIENSLFAEFCKHLMKMETQKIVNLLNISQNEYSNLQQKNGTLLTMNEKKFIHMEIQSNF